MNVLFLDQYSDLGGAQMCLLDVLPAARERRWSLHVVAPGQGPLGHRATARGAAFDSLPGGRYSLGRKSPADAARFAWDTRRWAAMVRRLARQSNANLIYVNGPRLLPAVWAAGMDRPVLFHCHNRLPQRYAAWLAGQSLRATKATVAAACRFAAAPLEPYVSPERLHLVYNGVPPGAPRVIRPGVNGRRRIGVIGRVAPEKGQETFLRAARLIAAATPDCEFVICGEALFGDPVAQRYQTLLQELAAGLPVRFLGWRDDVYNVLSGLDLLVVPSIREPATTRVILEAYACGVPVVAFPSGGISEIVIDGRTGFHVEHMAPEALASRICLILKHPDRLQDAAAGGLALWRERFTLQRYQHEITELMERAARR